MIEKFDRVSKRLEWDSGSWDLSNSINRTNRLPLTVSDIGDRTDLPTRKNVYFQIDE